MSQGDVETVRRIYASLTRGDDVWQDLVDPELVVDFSRRLVDPFVARGLHDPVFVSLYSQALAIWEDWPTWEPEQLIAAERNVFAFIRTSGRGKASGALVEARVANVWRFGNTKPVEFMYFGEDRAAALAAAGVRE